MRKKKYNLFAEQYIEVCSQDDGSWNVELVIETLRKHSFQTPVQTLRHSLANFQTMGESDEFADSLRYLYDKSIFEFELM